MRSGRLSTTGLVFGLGASFCLISILSHYEIDTSRKINLDIALMLTPSGIIDNLLLHSDSSPLAPYYSHLTEREGLLKLPLLLGVIALHLGLAAWGLVHLKRRSLK